MSSHQPSCPETLGPPPSCQLACAAHLQDTGPRGSSRRGLWRREATHPTCLLSPRDCSEQASAQSEGGRLGSGLQLVRCDPSDPGRGHSSSHSPGTACWPRRQAHPGAGESTPVAALSLLLGAGWGTQTQLFREKWLLDSVLQHSVSVPREMEREKEQDGGAA